MKGVFLTIVMLLVGSLGAQNKFTYEDISRGMFTARSVSGVRSMSDGENYTTLEEGKIVKYSYKTGDKLGLLFDDDVLKPSDYQLSYDEKKILLTTKVAPIYRHSFSAEYWIYDIESKSLKKISEGGSQQVASLSPDGEMCAFVRENNLFIVDIASGVEKQITTDGRFNYIINGIPDWVYEEEYSFSKAYEWSPNSQMIAFYRFDEERVKQFSMNIFGDKLYPSVYTYKYPKAGEENAIVSIFTYSLRDGKSVKMNLGENSDQYIPRIKWTPKGELVILRLNRAQNNFDMLVSDPLSGDFKIAYNERDSRYVERIDDETITFIDNDRYIVKSEKDGYFHLYLYSISKGELNQITSGNWDVTSVLGYSLPEDRLYYISAETSPLRRNLYSVKLNGEKKTRITELDGIYNVRFSDNFKYYISYFSNSTTPNTVTLHDVSGNKLRDLETNSDLKVKIKEIDIPVKEFFTFKTSEGVELNGYILKPCNFDADKKYPLLMTQYSGPGSQSVSDSWAIGWEYALTQQGYVIACIDGRGTGFRGADFKKCTYKNLGYYEVIDQTEAAIYLGSLDFIDPDRIGIYGWSYGGFMSLNCILKANDVFKLAISIAPVTSWRFYDTIYTELYNGMPQENGDGYDKNSPMFFADRLKGKLLIAHGTADDNVHVQNSYMMINRLVEADKDFEMYIYPDKNHSMLPAGKNHLMKKCMDFLNNNL